VPALGRSWLKTWRQLARDPFLGQALLLVLPISILAQGSMRQPVLVAGVVGLFVIGQAAIGLATRRIGVRRRLAVTVARFAVNVVFVACGELLVSGTGLLALAYLPLVGVAASFGLRQVVAVAGVTVVCHSLIEALQRAPDGDALHRSAVFASVTIVMAIVSRRQVARLNHARLRMRRAITFDRRRARQIAGIEAIGRILAAGPTEEALDRVVARIASELGYQCVSIYLGDETHVRLGAQRGYVELVDTFDGTHGIVGRVMRTGRAAFVPDVSADPDYVGLNPHIASEICVPLLADGEFLGFVNVESTAARPLDQTDLRLMVAVADRLAAALTIGRERQRLAERAELFHNLHQFSEAVNASLEASQQYDAIVRGIPSVVAADITALVVLERNSGRYYLRALHGSDPGSLGSEVRLGEGMAGRAIRDRTITVDEQFGPAHYPSSVADLAPTPPPPPMQGAAVPLIREGTVVGAITVLRLDGTRAFSQLDLDALSLIAEQVSLAVANSFLHADVHELAVRDPLTGLFNRRYLDPALEQLMAQRAREASDARPRLSIVMFDLDHFSELNNRHGHQAGDAVLRAFGALLRARTRATDIAARFGGEEFAVVLYRAGLDDAMRMAEEIRSLIGSLPIDGPNGEDLLATVSAGCAEAGPEASTPEALLRVADVALYMAKRAGRNRVVAA
jgi:diguanylate cyclase (GGDEF)-like protein